MSFSIVPRPVTGGRINCRPQLSNVCSRPVKVINMFVIKQWVLFLFGVIISGEAARILAYYPTPSISHQVVFRPITAELVKRGHDVTVITTNPMFPNGNGPYNLKEIDVRNVTYAVIEKHFTTAVSGKESDLENEMRTIRKFYTAVIEEQATVEGFRNILQNHTDDFDLILLEALYMPILGMTHVFHAPTILISSFGAFPGNYEAVGAPTHPIIYPNIYRQTLYNLTMWEKLKETFNQILITYLMNKNDEAENKMMQKVFGEDVPPLNILKNNIDMIFLNINPIWEGNNPVPPNVIHMGGLHQKPPKKLPEDLQSYIDSSKNGVIYFSFGTNVKPSSLPPEKMAMFEKVFAKLQYNVIWKWDSENFPVKSENIKMSKWLPQPDLLRHPNVKLFITQGGLQSTDEAITAGVPLIGIPMIGDQWYNVEKYVYHKIGVRLDLDKLNEQQLMEAIIEVVENESYRKNIENLRSLMQDQSQTPLERSIWWIEYVLRHKGAKHLRSPAANISWSEYLELELVGVLLLGTIIFTGIIVLSMRFVISHMLSYIAGNKKVKNA